MTIKIKKAVSVILKYKDEIYYIKRQNFLRAFPGYTAFPGGKVDKEDLDLIHTVKREIQEELQFELGDELDYQMIAKATSPSFNPYRYETYFYLIELDSKPSFIEDTNEIFESGWVDPQVICDEYMAGTRLLVPPVRKVFERLSKKQVEYIDFNIGRFDQNLTPMIESINGLKQFMPLSNTILPATRTNSFLIGDEFKILVDPSPKDKAEYEIFLNTLKREQVDCIFITHHHPDHHQYSTNLAKDLSVPVMISKDSFNRINSKIADYFEKVEVRHVEEGDTVTSWLGHKVQAYAIPGHDEGHIGLAPESLDWFIVGDLFQGVGTVVVGGDEGCMTKYMNSLERVISLSPGCVIPSHGIALGGTHILEKTLKHRVLREEQILELHNKGKTNTEICNAIYFNIPREVIKYAMANIESHLTKLRTDGIID